MVKLGDSVTPRWTLLGVPQGSVLGPKFFILDIKDICKITKLFFFLFFDNDTNVFCSRNNLQKVQKDIAIEMNKPIQWFDRDR